jgi:hypothetical protein
LVAQPPEHAAATDPELAQLIKRWPTLGESVKAALRAVLAACNVRHD